MTAYRVYRRHLNAMHYCARGSREFFQKHGMSWADFLRNGVEREALEKLKDAMADKAIAVADAEIAEGAGRG